MSTRWGKAARSRGYLSVHFGYEVPNPDYRRQRGRLTKRYTTDVPFRCHLYPAPTGARSRRSFVLMDGFGLSGLAGGTLETCNPANELITGFCSECPLADLVCRESQASRNFMIVRHTNSGGAQIPGGPLRDPPGSHEVVIEIADQVGHSDRLEIRHMRRVFHGCRL